MEALYWPPVGKFGSIGKSALEDCTSSVLPGRELPMGDIEAVEPQGCSEMIMGSRGDRELEQFLYVHPAENFISTSRYGC